MNRIFADEVELLEGASAQRERMRMMMLTTGTISMKGNGQVYEYDYGVDDEHKVTVTKGWSDPSATILDDIRTGITKIVDDTGVTVERAVCSSKVFGYIRANTEIKKSIYVMTDGVGFVSDAKVKQFIKDELGIDIVVYDKRYKDEEGAVQRYVPEDVLLCSQQENLETHGLVQHQKNQTLCQVMLQMFLLQIQELQLQQ